MSPCSSFTLNPVRLYVASDCEMSTLISPGPVLFVKKFNEISVSDFLSSLNSLN